MTEQEFDQQVWRRFDIVTTDTGIETTVMNVCFTTRSVRIFVKNAPPEWLPCNRIVTHTTRKGGDADDGAIIEELHNRVLGLQDRVDKLTEEKAKLIEQMKKNHAGELLTQVNIIGSQLNEKKKRIEKIETSVQLIREIVEKIHIENV